MPEPLNVEVAVILLGSCRDLLDSYANKGPSIPAIIGKVAIIQIDEVLSQLA